ncbi:MAG: helicase, partial [Beijerinckiaceae bacterium]|nr:helicase [Beijerinckiaceae bacterium]
FIANRSGWLRDPGHWQTVTRQVEDRLSDALHERLAQRFVDRRTSVLMRRLRENAMLEAEVTPGGDVLVEGQHVGQLTGFRFTADPEADGEAARTLNAAAQKALASEIESRATRLSEAVDDAILLANDGIVRWLGEAVGRLCEGGQVLEPRVSILADEQLSGQALAMVQLRLDRWLTQHMAKLLGPLSDLEKGEGLDGIARGIAFQVAESLGVLDRARVADDVKCLSQDARAALRKFGVRFGAYHLYLPNLIKPAPRALAAQLYALNHAGDAVSGLDDLLHLAASGRTSFSACKDIPRSWYRAAGFRVCGDRAVRVDILERLADLIRPAVSYRPGVTPGDPPPGAADADGFVVTVAMTSLAGCSGDSFASILRALGYSPEQRRGPPITVPAPAANKLSEPREAETMPQSAGPAADTEKKAGAAEAGPPAPWEARGTISNGCVGQDSIAALVGAHEGTGAGRQMDDSNGPPHKNGAGSSLAETADSEELIEIWRPHHHPRKSDARTGKRHIGRREGAAAGGFQAAAPADAATQEPAVQHDEAAAVQADTGNALAAEPAVAQTAPGQSALHASQLDTAERGTGEPRARSGVRHRSRHQAGGQNRKKVAERQERRGGHPGATDTRSGERPPDPNSPFAKLLVLKARMEEKNNPEG